MHEYRTYYQVSQQLKADRDDAARWNRNAAFREALMGGEGQRRTRFQLGRWFRRFSFGLPRRTRQPEAVCPALHYASPTDSAC